jgi:hypothetical protein
MAKRRKITPEMIRKYFGPDANVEERFFGGFRVTTRTGGDVEITQTETRLHAGGDDVYEALTLLSAEAWGGMTAFGPHEHVVAMMAHGEALGVSVTPQVKTGGGCLRIFAAPFVFMMALGGVSAAGGHPVIGFSAAALVTGWVWNAMKKSAEREGRRQAQVLRYPHPRIHGGHRQATRDDAARQGWL